MGEGKANMSMDDAASERNDFSQKQQTLKNQLLRKTQKYSKYQQHLMENEKENTRFQLNYTQNQKPTNVADEENSRISEEESPLRRIDRNLAASSASQRNPSLKSNMSNQTQKRVVVITNKKGQQVIMSVRARL